MARLTALEQAQSLALKGHIDEALSKLQTLKATGKTNACAALAEISGYRRQWREVLEHVRCALGDPSALDTLNVYSDLALLAARAGDELGDWPAVMSIAQSAASALSNDPGDQTRLSVALRLADAAERRNVQALVIDSVDAADLRRAKFEAAVQKMAQTKMKFRSESDRLDHLFGLARAYRYPAGAVEVFTNEGRLPALFPNVVFAASALVGQQRPDDAWLAIRSSITGWLPIAPTQIVPVALIGDTALFSIMSVDRCEELLRTARGSAAE